jgi:hypothetical protein
MTGTVTISLEDFENLQNSSKNAKELQNKLKLASKEIEVFLSFLCTRENIQVYVDEFNSQSKTKIKLIDGRAKIQLNE